MRQLDSEYKESHLNYKKRLIKLKPSNGNLTFERKGSDGFLPPIRNKSEARYRNKDIKVAKEAHEYNKRDERKPQHAVYKSMDFSQQEPILTKEEENRIKNFDNSDLIFKPDLKPSVESSSKTLVESQKPPSNLPSSKTIPKPSPKPQSDKSLSSTSQAQIPALSQPVPQATPSPPKPVIHY